MNIQFLDEKDINDTDFNLLNDGDISDLLSSYNKRSILPIYAVKQVLDNIYKYNSEWKLNLFVDDMKNSLHINNKYVKDIVEKFTSENVNILYNHRSRLESYIYFIKNYISYTKTNYICTITRIKRYNNFINYGYVYSVVDTKQDVFFIKDIYICTGPNIVSSDGEYRSRFSLITLIKNIEHAFNDLWTTVETYLLKDKSIKYEYSYHIPSQFDIGILTELENNNKSSRNSIKIFIMIWLVQCLLISMNLQILNTDGNYYSNIINKKDMEFFDTILLKFGIDYIKKFYLYSNYFDTPVRKIDISKVIVYPIVGQKIIPLSNDNTDINITKYTWNELYISLLVGDLLINNICPGVSMTYDWFYINNIDRTVFTNNIGDKYIQTKRAIVILTEYVGRTVDSLKYYGNNEKYLKYIGRLYQESSIFDKYLFDILYTLMCLNLRLNVIHGDLHLNNITMLRAYKKYIQDIKEFNDKLYESYTLYIIDNDIFYFKNIGIIGTIIDFSRSFIYKDNCDKYLKTMIADRIYVYYQQLFPSFILTHGVLLKQKMETNLKDIYSLFASIDIYIMSLKLKQNIDGTTHPDIIAKVNIIYKTSHTYILTYMTKYIEGKLDIQKIPNINKYLIYILYKKNIYNNDMDISTKINSVFNLNNQLQFSHSLYAKLPKQYYNDYIQKNNNKLQLSLQNYDNIKNMYKINDMYKFLCY